MESISTITANCVTQGGRNVTPKDPDRSQVSTTNKKAKADGRGWATVYLFHELKISKHKLWFYTYSRK